MNGYLQLFKLRFTTTTTEIKECCNTKCTLSLQELNDFIQNETELANAVGNISQSNNKTKPRCLKKTKFRHEPSPMCQMKTTGAIISRPSTAMSVYRGIVVMCACICIKKRQVSKHCVMQKKG